MKHAARLLLAFLVFGTACEAQTYSPEGSLRQVATVLMTWHDARRDRDVPVKIYYPANATRPCPLIIFSHGLGGSREGYGYLGERWAERGYISVHLQHIGSDDSVWRGAGMGGYGALVEAAKNPQSALNRANDVRFAIDRMLALNHEEGSAFEGLVNTQEIGMAGHSFGAWTTLAVVGENLNAWRGFVDPGIQTAVGRGRSFDPGINATTPGRNTVDSAINASIDPFVDPRIKAAIAMSAPVPGGAANASGQFAEIRVPVFHMTGTRDDSPIGETDAAERRIPYDQSTTPGTCLMILNGADHMTFSGHILGVLRREDGHFQKYILAGSVAFWDAQLRGNKVAADWLYKGGFAKMLDGQGTFETR